MKAVKQKERLGGGQKRLKSSQENGEKARIHD